MAEACLSAQSLCLKENAIILPRDRAVARNDAPLSRRRLVHRRWLAAKCHMVVAAAVRGQEKGRESSDARVTR